VQGKAAPGVLVSGTTLVPYNNSFSPNFGLAPEAMDKPKTAKEVSTAESYSIVAWSSSFKPIVSDKN
jgi:hypothetical protein